MQFRIDSGGEALYNTCEFKMPELGVNQSGAVLANEKAGLSGNAAGEGPKAFFLRAGGLAL